MKKLLSLILVGIIVIQSALSGITIYANDITNDYIYKYSGVTHSNGYNVTCTLTVTQIAGERFRGTFSAEGISIYSFSNKPISGNVVFGTDLLTCIFQVKFYNDRYYSNIYATISPYEGVADCVCSGSWHFESFKMTGEKQLIKEYSPSINMANYNEDDMKLCMSLSKAAYSTTFSESTPDEIIAISKLNNFNTNGLTNSNAHRGRGDENNISYTILPNFSKDDNSVDLYVILRGTTEEEWQGNMDITGEEFKDVKQHQSFLNGSEYLKNKINQYFDSNYEYYKNLSVNLYITGHSRGAAVANLYAKYVSDNRNLGTIDEKLFANSVTAYTFATPNVEKFHYAMSDYNNIFNFCFYEDFVPTIPLTMPTEGWDYWKYGYTYWVSLSDLRKEQPNSNISFVNKNDVVEVHNTMTKWNSVKKYYEEPCYDFNNAFSITAYNFFHNSFAKAMMPGKKNKAIGFYSLYADYKQFPDFVPLILVAGKNISTIINAHNYTTYNDIISSYGSSCFSYCSYESYKNIFSNINYFEDDEANTYLLNNNDISYNNQDEMLSLSSFANQSDNLPILGWVIDDPSTWEGITWNADGNVESIDLSFKNLSGELDLSGFSSLKSLDLSGNEITDVTLSNCSSLEEIDCSFNKLSSLDLSDCTNLNSIICCYNYLDTHEGSALYNTLDDLMFDDVYVNYYPQSVPDNATFNTAELNALKTFANIDSNNSVLDWLDEDGNIDTNKLQNNVLFEYDGSNYRIVAIDISELEITGSLDLTAFAQLKELYCSQTGITSVNVNNCTKLEIIDCSDSQLSMLTLPSNSGDKNTPLYKVMCENNHLDINIFTDDIIKYVTFKAGSQLDYKHQIINASADEFDENDYNALCTFANQKDNLSSLDWDLTAPSEWDYVNWKLDTVSGKYKLLDCYFDCLDITGDIDLSGCTALEYASFSGSDIETAKLPVLTEKLYTANTVETVSLGANENAFYDCPKLEAVVISPLAEKIESGAFYNCKALQAVYVPESVISIADNSFGNCPNLTLAGADETTVSEYAFENSISFEEGYFLCARVNCQENTSGTFSAYYPIEDAQIINGDTVCAQTDEYGFFTVFGLEDGQYSYTVSYKFGFNVPLNASISGGCKTVTPPIAMPAFNFNRDGYITMRDYTMLVKITQDSEDFKYYDINRDSVIDNVEKNLFTGLWNMAASDVISYNV